MCLAWCYSFSSAFNDAEDYQYYCHHSAQSPSLSTCSPLVILASVFTITTTWMISKPISHAWTPLLSSLVLCSISIKDHHQHIKLNTSKLNYHLISQFLLMEQTFSPSLNLETLEMSYLTQIPSTRQLSRCLYHVAAQSASSSFSPFNALQCPVKT